MYKFQLLLLFCLLTINVFPQSKTVLYKQSNDDMLNPERGFYIPIETRASNFILLDTTKLKALRNNPQQPRRASFAVNVTLLYRSYELDVFKNSPLSATFLANLQKDFDAVRIAGLKMILRFAYTNTSHGGDCGDESKICPPYGDAPRNVVLNHILQLKSLLQKNAGVIAVLQEGFIGIWGESYYTDFFGDASSNGTGRMLDSSWLHRNELLKTLLDALPENRMVQVRTPQIKQKFMYGPAAKVESLPLEISVAYNKSYASRIGFHNDCFLSSPDDYGTYQDYGSSSQQRHPANEVLRKFIEADTKYTVVGGETCDDAFSPQNDCAPAGHAEEEMRQMHYSYLNASYNKDVNNDWDSGGCVNSIKRKLGYRFALQKAVFPLQVKRSSGLAIDFIIDNRGYASLYNPRPVKIIFRSKSTKQEFAATLKTNPQFWFSGEHHIKETVDLPAGITPGSYELFLCLPDADELLANRPEYSIHLANENVWEAASGYNDLHHTLRVQ